MLDIKGVKTCCCLPQRSLSSRSLARNSLVKLHLCTSSSVAAVCCTATVCYTVSCAPCKVAVCSTISCAGCTAAICCTVAECYPLAECSTLVECDPLAECYPLVECYPLAECYTLVKCCTLVECWLYRGHSLRVRTALGTGRGRCRSQRGIHPVLPRHPTCWTGFLGVFQRLQPHTDPPSLLPEQPNPATRSLPPA